MTSHVDLSDVGDGPPILVVSHNEQEVFSMA